MTGQDDGHYDDPVMAPETASAMERRLLDAFAAHHAALRESAARASSPRSTRQRWIAAAALLAVIAGGVQAWRAGRSAYRGSQVSTAPDEKNGQRRGQDSPPQGAAVAPAADGRSGLPAPAPVTRRSTAAAVTRPGRAAPHKRPQPAAADTPGAEFVAVPGAAGLPEFESGSIVRVELPVASLPRYGVDISRAAGEDAISADLLVGQDGEPRGIRLVTTGNSLNSPRSGK